MSDSERLIECARQGDRSAVDHLFALHRERLRAMVALRLDRRLAGRVDPSDVVQDAMTEASRRLTEYLSRDDYPFYPWLRRIAWDRLIQLHRVHVLASKRSVDREARPTVELSDASVCYLADHLQGSIASPSQLVVQEESRQAVRRALEQLDENDREIILLRHVEQMPTKEIAAMFGVSYDALRSRYRRALEQLHALLSESRNA